MTSHFHNYLTPPHIAQVNFNLLALLALHHQQRLGRTQLNAAAAAGPFRNLVSASAPPRALPTTTTTNPDKLPHYPLPALDDTLQKYLRSVQPLLSADAFERTKRLVGEFGGPHGEGAQLHALLSKRAATSENWLSDWWLKYAYLGYRAPVVCNSNPGLYYDVRHFGGVDEWLSHAARTIWATMRFKQQIDTKQIPADKMGKALLDMAQYGRIFGTCRIPRPDFDAIEYHPESDYVTVAFRNGVSGWLYFDTLFAQFRSHFVFGSSIGSPSTVLTNSCSPSRSCCICCTLSSRTPTRIRRSAY